MLFKENKEVRIMRYVSQNQLDRWDNTIRLVRMRRSERGKTPGMGRTILDSNMKLRVPGIRSSNRDIGNHLQTT